MGKGVLTLVLLLVGACNESGLNGAQQAEVEDIAADVADDRIGDVESEVSDRDARLAEIEARLGL